MRLSPWSWSMPKPTNVINNLSVQLSSNKAAVLLLLFQQSINLTDKEEASNSTKFSEYFQVLCTLIRNGIKCHKKTEYQGKKKKKSFFYD